MADKAHPELTDYERAEMLRNALMEAYASMHAENWHRRGDFRSATYNQVEETLSITRPCK